MAGHFSMLTGTRSAGRVEWCPEQTSEVTASKGNTMVCYTYILLCADNSFYVGHTHDLDARFRAHQFQRGAKHTATHGAAGLIYFEQRATEDEAIARERQIKKWSRAKKIALINGNRKRLRLLSKSRD